MSDLRDLYQQLILDHGRHPRNFSVLPEADRIKEGFNPLCGDQLIIFLHTDADQIKRITFQGCGCAISIASASLMVEFLQTKTFAQAKAIFHDFHEMVTNSDSDVDVVHLGKLMVLKGVSEFPARVKCATLAWHTLVAALDNNPAVVSTE